MLADLMYGIYLAGDVQNRGSGVTPHLQLTPCADPALDARSICLDMCALSYFFAPEIGQHCINMQRSRPPQSLDAASCVRLVQNFSS